MSSTAPISFVSGGYGQTLLAALYIAAAGGNVTVGLQAALTDFAAKSNAGSAPQLILDPVTYPQLTAQLTVPAANGGRIIGEPLQTVLVPPPGQTSALRFASCRNVKAQGLTISSPTIATTTVGPAGAAAGSTTIPVASGASFTNGTPIVLASTTGALAFGEEVTITAGAGTTSITVSPALRHSYASGATIYCNPTPIAFESYSDAVTYPGFQPTQLTLEDCFAVNMAKGAAFTANGGPGGGSDRGNDHNKLVRFRTQGFSLAGQSIEMLNSLINEFTSCVWGATSTGQLYGVLSLAGGSFSISGGMAFVTAYMLALGGQTGASSTCIMNVEGLQMTDSTGGVLQALAGDSLSYANVRLSGCSNRNTTSVGGTLMFDVTGTLNTINVADSYMGAAGSSSTTWSMSFKDTAGGSAGPKTSVSFERTKLGANGFTANAVAVEYWLCPWASDGTGAVHETLSNGATSIGRGGGLYANSFTTAPERQDAMFGIAPFVPSTPVQAAAYTADAGQQTDTVIPVSSTSTQTLPTLYRTGVSRRVTYVATAAPITVTIDPPSGGNINGSASATWSPTAKGQRYECLSQGTDLLTWLGA